VQQAALDKLVAGSLPAEVARERAAVAEARAAKGYADTELGRTRKLVEAHAVPAANLDTALTTSRQADARLASANESLRLVAQGSRGEDIAGGRAMVEVAQANVAAAQTALDDTRLLAPSPGVVTSRVREVGAIVSPNDVVYVVALTRSVWVRTYVSEAALGKLRPGTEVAVQSDSEPRHPYRGHVGFVSPTAEFTPKSVETPELRTSLVYRLRVNVDDPAPGLRQGMPVTVVVATSGA
jgi:HlyD family secretion protein